MAQIRQFIGSFVGGEVTPEFAGRVNDDKYQAGVAKMRNFFALPHGPTRNRPGFEFVAKVKERGARLLRFSFSTTQTMVIEMGAGYFRFHTDGATLVTEDGEPYEVENQYSQSDLMSVKYVQSGDVLTLVHPNYPSMELSRYGALDWRFTPITFTAPISAPTNITISKASMSSNSYTYEYVVTSVNNDKWESEASDPVSITGNLYDTGATITLSWGAVTGATKYRIYKKSTGVWGYIGITEGLKFVDNLITANINKVPPEYDVSLNTEGHYAGAVTYFEQRRCFARSKKHPQTIWMTKTGTAANFSMPIVTNDDDAIEVEAETRDANTILHLVPLASLVVLTSSSELICQGASNGAITQKNIQIKPQAYVGASDVQPVVVNNIMLYVSARGNHVRELGYNYQANGMVTGDLSLRSPHLFDGKRTVDMAFSASPYPIAWLINNEGELIGFTYIPEEGIGGWHLHTTDGKFKSCCVVTENNDDRLYVIVERVINNEVVQYVERMADMLVNKLEDAHYVDSGLKYEGEPVQRLSGLDHLEGKKVSILGDGAVMPQETVVDGQITIDYPCSKIIVGLPYESVLQTLPVMAQVDSAYGTGRTKNINRCCVRVHRSSGIFAGFDENHLTEYKQRKNESPGSPPDLVSEEIEIVPDGHWNDNGQLSLVQKNPVPTAVIYINNDISIGG